MKLSNALVFLFLAVFMLTLVSAETEVTYFYGNGCPHCANVANSGILEEVDALDNVTVTKYEVASNTELYDSMRAEQGVPQGWPLAFIICEDTNTYLRGDTPIINNLEKVVETCENVEVELSWMDKLNLKLEHEFNSNLNGDTGALSLTGWGILIFSAAIDAINPCAIGVLVFLMMALLNMGSAKRALRAGLLYSIVVFVVYFLAGLGIFTAIQSLTRVGVGIHLFIGILAILFGLVEWNDVYRESKGKKAHLAISEKIKPFIEKMTQKGTLAAVLVLGVVVSLFELPCTGAIYGVILSVLAKAGNGFPILYLAVYNFIFVLPLIVLTFLIYKGVSPKMLEAWNQKEKRWMRLGAGALLVLLGVVIILSL